MTRRRSGYMIIELLLVMTALVIVLGLCVGLIHALHRLSRIGTDHLAEASARDRLARQFRQDVRAASRSSLAAADADGKVELHGPGQRVIEYAPGDGRVVRTERDGGRQLRREDYRFPSRAAARFRRRDEDGAQFVILSLRRDAAASPTAGALRGDCDFEAQLGRDARLARRQGGGS